MLNIKFTLVFCIQSLKFLFHSVIHGLSYSLKDILESKSKFTQHHALLSQRQHCQYHCFITRDFIQEFFEILAGYRYQFGIMFADKNSFQQKNHFYPIQSSMASATVSKTIWSQINFYTTSCFAVTKTTLSTSLFYHQRFDSSIISNFGKLQVLFGKMFVDKNNLF